MNDISIEEIYNLWLRALRKKQNKPFRPRKNFLKIEEEDFYPFLAKLETFFRKHPHLLRFEFFWAPYEVYPHSKNYYGLDFFASYKGLSTCVSYFRLKEQQNPDEQIDHIKDSLAFITKFCIEKGILFEQYAHYKTISQNDCLKHLKNFQISWFLIYDIPGLIQILTCLPSDEFSLYFGDNISLSQIAYKYTHSKVAVPYIKTKVQQIKKYITKKLHEQS